MNIAQSKRVRELAQAIEKVTVAMSEPQRQAFYRELIERDRAAERAARYPLDPPGYAERVRELEEKGLTTSDAQGVADVEFGLVGRMQS